MSNLSSFLHPVEMVMEKEIIISKRFVDEKGNPVPFKIKALTQEENEKLVKASTKVEIKNGQRLEYMDSAEFARRVVVAATVEPDFSDKAMCDAYGVVSPMLVPGKMLLSGEYNKLMQAIMDLSGISDNEGEELKN